MDYWAKIKHNMETMNAKTLLDKVREKREVFAKKESEIDRAKGNAKLVGEALKEYNQAKRKRLELEHLESLLFDIIKEA